MAVTASLIETLHRINRQKTDLSNQLARGPKTVAAAKARLAQAEQELADQQAAIKRMKMEADSKQLQLKEREGKIHTLEGKLNSAKENREYQTLKEQIAADKQANLVLSDEILEILEGIDTEEERLKEAEQKVADTRSEAERIETQVAEKKVRLEEELTRIESELKEAEKGLSGDFKRDYTRLVAAKGEDAMAELDGGSCGGCYQTLTPQLLEKLSVGNPVICPTCGCIIYQKAKY